MKEHLRVEPAWSVGRDSELILALSGDDSPVIPSDQPNAPRFELIDQLRRDPIAGMHDDVCACDFVPHLRGQVACAFGDMGIGNQQQSHEFYAYPRS